jgi:glycosyltransferase involved in cell wall biosynthesis
VVVRPGVDFSALQKTRKSPLRSELGIPTDACVVLCTEPRGVDDETLAVFWTCSLLDRLDQRYAVIIPGSGRVVEKLSRFASTLPSSAKLIAPGDNARFEELEAIVDAMVVPNTGDISTTSIAWAMAAGVPTIAAAGYAVTELIVARVNGLLYKHPEGKSPASKIIPLLRDRDAQRKTAEAARGQAYEVFSLRRCVEQHIQVYENVLSGAPASQGITDPAQVA